MAGIVRFSLAEDGGKNRILFSNPDNLSRHDGKERPGKDRDRINMTVKLSEDDGRTWTHQRSLDPDSGIYSDLAVTRDGTILCFYGCNKTAKEPRPRSGDRLRLARFNLEWLKEGNTPVQQR